MFNENHHNQSPEISSFAHRYGLHLLVAGSMTGLDCMMFNAFEAPSMELMAPVCAFVGMAMILPCALVQKYAYGDNWGAAWGKSMLVGLLTAFPTPLPSFLTAAWGVMGVIGMVERNRARTVESTQTDDQDSSN